MSEPRPLKCFISYSAESAADAAELFAMLQELGVDAFVSAGEVANIPPQIGTIGTVSAADCVAAVLTGGPSPWVWFELGLAIGLGKPVMFLERQANTFKDVLAGARIVRIKTDDVRASLPDVRRFLRHVRPKGEISVPKEDANRAALKEAASAVSDRHNVTSGRELYLVDALASLFRVADFEVLTEPKTEADERPDLIVWNDDLVAEFGGPMIVECKYYRGSTGSVFHNAQHSLKQLAGYVENSSAALGLLVFDHDRPTRFEVENYSTPNAFAVSVDGLVNTITEGTLADDLWRWRARATGTPELRRDAR
ncbi:hypothetical protein [Cupriavidus sp. WS]|uniref:hypothetical protein n=1 Tax=Cupriavidus sp. WS TaxID=1312922 RepID=UPI0018C97EAF|nr:hypothetical protein [Cupriavidus sp. WS]